MQVTQNAETTYQLPEDARERLAASRDADSLRAGEIGKHRGRQWAEQWADYSQLDRLNDPDDYEDKVAVLVQIADEHRREAGGETLWEQAAIEQSEEQYVYPNVRTAFAEAFIEGALEVFEAFESLA